MKFEYTEIFQFQLELSQAICKKIAEIDKTDISKTEWLREISKEILWKNEFQSALIFVFV